MENKSLVQPKPIMIKGTRDKIIVEIGLHYTDTYNEQLLCYTNAVPNPDGGTHSSGFRGSCRAFRRRRSMSSPSAVRATARR